MAEGARPQRYERIAVEEGFTIPEIVALQRSRNAGMPPTPQRMEVVRALLDLGEGRIRTMDEDGIAKQVCVLAGNDHPGHRSGSGQRARRAFERPPRRGRQGAARPHRRARRVCAARSRPRRARARARGQDARPQGRHRQFPFGGRVSRRPQILADLRGGPGDGRADLHPSARSLAADVRTLRHAGVQGGVVVGGRGRYACRAADLVGGVRRLPASAHRHRPYGRRPAVLPRPHRQPLLLGDRAWPTPSRV